MPRLFVALDFPDDVLQGLVELQQPEQTGVRWIPRAQIHLTLHFLGDTALEPVKAALASVMGPAFNIELSGVGQFQSADGGTILWAGIERNESLIRLRAAVATALAVTGFQPEARPYAPHLTLARCRRQTSRLFLRAWKTQHDDFRSGSFVVDHITLYSSVLQSDGSLYRVEQTIALDG